MRILTFNVNSLSRLLNHPLQHIVKRKNEGNTNHTATAADTNPSATSTTSSLPPFPHPPPVAPHHLRIASEVDAELEEDDDDDEEGDAKYDRYFNDGTAADADADIEFEFDTDERFAWMRDDQKSHTPRSDHVAAAVSTATAAAAAASSSTATAASSNMSSSSPFTRTAQTHSQPLSQLEIDQHQSTREEEWRERSRHLATTAASSISSIHATLSTRLVALLDALEADIICFQEVKLSRAKMTEPFANVPGYSAYYSFSRRRQGYSGVVTYCKQTACPLAAEEGFTGIIAKETSGTAAAAAAASSSTSASNIGCTSGLQTAFSPILLKALDSEGRCIMTDHGAFILVNCYFPNAYGDDGARAEYKTNFYQAMQVRCEELVKSGRHVIVVGDVNACHQEIDHVDFSADMRAMKRMKKAASVAAAAKRNKQQSLGATRKDVENHDDEIDYDREETKEEASAAFRAYPSRLWLHHFLVDGGGMFVDVFRRFYPDRQHAYTCWNMKTGARLSNYGTRIDYVLADQGLVDSGFFQKCEIRTDVQCSDHCPVEVDFNLPTLCSDPQRQPPPLCSKYYPEFSGTQQSIQNFFTKGAATPPSTAAPQSLSPSKSQSSSPSASLKRPASLPTTSSTSSSSSKSHQPAAKKSKLSGSMSSTKKNVTATSANNMSLHSFFASKPAPITEKKKENRQDATNLPSLSTGMISPDLTRSPYFPVASSSSPTISDSNAMPSPSTIASSTASASPTPSSSSSDLSHTIDPTPTSTPSSSVSSLVESSSAWKQLLNQQTTEIKCTQHNLRCALRTTTKTGPNYGRQFYMCALVPPEQCQFFKWFKELSKPNKFKSRE